MLAFQNCHQELEVPSICEGKCIIRPETRLAQMLRLSVQEGSEHLEES